MLERTVEEVRVHVVDERQVQAVEPDHRAVGRVAVVVKRPGRGEHKVTGAHDRVLPVHRRVGALPFDDEPQRGRRMLVSGRDFAGEDELQPGVEVHGGGRRRPQAGVHQHQHPTFGLLGGDDLTGTHQERPQIRIAPQERDRRAFRLCRQQRAEPPPQRLDVVGRQLVVEGRCLGRLGEFGHGRPFRGGVLLYRLLFCITVSKWSPRAQEG